MPTDWVLDASALGKLVREEAESGALHGFLQDVLADRHRIWVPTLARYELASILQRDGRPSAQARILWKNAMQVVQERPVRPSFRHADLTAYDAAYLDLVRRLQDDGEHAGLVTYDRAMRDAAIQAGMECRSPSDSARPR